VASEQATAPERLRRRADFLRVSAKGRRVAVHGLVLQALNRDDGCAARIGFTVTKRVGNAVTRNRIRRRLKEATRLVFRQRPIVGMDLVLIGRAATSDRPFAELLGDLGRALDKAGVP
jgi:ribonuclease P protein component